jgi:hypothetical protein
MTTTQAREVKQPEHDEGAVPLVFTGRSSTGRLRRVVRLFHPRVGRPAD